ncbi:hypothetical protein [Streptomyces sp. HUAS TT20]|uniref:hypothetical protein n=1 Tax=Streptomyces sp. HUAS TT20 TaxID=3447509 RepID=UPI0021DB509F|nr:hypothetical protein [Streptomyces sp. HUAS 15-9]UXY27544.1 hypothetical protein N8I87_13775 [Streptomyces sp. HUAS 15-9]
MSVVSAMSVILSCLADRRSRSRSRRAAHPDVTGPDALKLFEDGTADMIVHEAPFLATLTS